MDGGAAVVLGSLWVFGLVAAGATLITLEVHAVVDIEFRNDYLVGRPHKTDQYVITEVAVYEIDAILGFCLVGGVQRFVVRWHSWWGDLECPDLLPQQCLLGTLTPSPASLLLGLIHCTAVLMWMVVLNTVELSIAMSQVVQNHLALQAVSVEVGNGDSFGTAGTFDALTRVPEVGFVHTPGWQVGGS